MTTFPEEDEVLEGTVEYAYDVFDRKIVRTASEREMINEVWGEPEVLTSDAYVYDGANVHLEFQPDGEDFLITKRYLFGPEVDQIFAEENVQLGSDPERVLWHFADNLGSTRDLYANDGSIVTQYRYTAFGQIIDGDKTKTRYLWTGREFDATTGLQYNRARWYSPDLARWMSEDPIGFAAGDANLYRYVRNGASYRNDPSGLIIETDCRIDSLLQMWGVTNWLLLRSGSKWHYQKAPLTNVTHGGTVAGEILARMMETRYVFSVSGAGSADEIANLREHMAARQRIIQFAQAKRFDFGTAEPAHPADGTDAVALFNQMNTAETFVGCNFGTRLVFYAGIGTWDSDLADKRSYDGVFVPGDWGYIFNRSFKWNPDETPDSNWLPGRSGENVIYAGNALFWGHFDVPNSFMTEAGWFAQINSWSSIDKKQKGNASWRDPRTELGNPVSFPATGLDP